MERQPDTLIIGAGPAGLAVAGCLRKAGAPFMIVERATTIGSSWRRHYDRLHLHTHRSHSALPYLDFPAGTPRYPSRAQMVAYLEQYAHHFNLAPQLGEEVQRVSACDGGWETRTSKSVYRTRRVVIAAGYNAIPYLPTWPGQERFRGPIIHSSEYRNGEWFRGQNVLVVGFGNSGGEIAIDLHEYGALVSMAVRAAVNVVPRDILGLPILSVSIALSRLPASLADLLAAPLLKLTIGDLSLLGLRRPASGPITQVRTTGRIPLLDVGTIRLIREGHIRVFGGVRAMTPTGVTFDDGREGRFDAIVLATGFRSGVGRFLHGGSPVVGKRRGLYFCGFVVSATGMLRDISREARQIAADIAGVDVTSRVVDTTAARSN